MLTDSIENYIAFDISECSRDDNWHNNAYLSIQSREHLTNAPEATKEYSAVDVASVNEQHCAQ